MRFKVARSSLHSLSWGRIGVARRYSNRGVTPACQGTELQFGAVQERSGETAITVHLELWTH